MITRRSLLTAVAAIGGGSVAWDFSQDDGIGSPGAGFCPSDDYLEDNPFVTGRLRIEDDGPFERTEPMTLVADLRNSGGVADTFDRSLRARLYDPERELVTESVMLTSVDRELPPESTTKIRMNVAAPASPGEWWLTMGSIAYSCDLIGELRVDIEVK